MTDDSQSLDLKLHHLLGISEAKLIVIRRLREALKRGNIYDGWLITSIMNDLQDRESAIANEAPLCLWLDKKEGGP